MIYRLCWASGIASHEQELQVASYTLHTGIKSVLLPRCMERRGLAISVCLSFCPSVKRVDCDKTEEKSVQIFIPYERTFGLVFWKEEWLL